jgi:hypothetical protein
MIKINKKFKIKSRVMSIDYSKKDIYGEMVIAEQLLKESLNFMNQVPNNKYGDNYELCSRINKFLKELE